MKTLDLAQESITVENLLKLASACSVRIVSADGHAFVLESADDFDKEVELLGKSDKFLQFLNERSKEPAKMSLEEYRRAVE